MAAIKVLIVEDSALVAEVLKDALESDKKVRVVGVASNGQQAIEMVPKLLPDLVTMDVWMPVMDGFATVEWIMANRPLPILVITSSKLKEDVQISLRMLAAGALDVMEKPSLSDEREWKRNRNELVSKVKLLSSVRVITHVKGKLSNLPNYKSVASLTSMPPKATPQVPKVTEPEVNLTPTPVRKSAVELPNNHAYYFPAATHYRAIALASSTGGPSALLQVLQRLPANFPCPIFVVQHISQGFTQGLIDWLQREVRLRIRMGEDNLLPKAGEVIFAPDKRNLLLQPDLKVITNVEETSILCPNADALMYSMAQVYNGRAIGVVLTGMGNDGAKGLKSMYAAGAYTIAQDEGSSLIYGMPRAAAETGAAREVLPLDTIPTRLIELLQQPANPEYRLKGKE